MRKTDIYFTNKFQINFIFLLIRQQIIQYLIVGGPFVQLSHKSDVYVCKIYRPMQLICMLLCIATVLTMKMRLTLATDQQRCFYQMLLFQQKYALEVIPLNQGTYEIAIRHKQDGQWVHAVHRTAKTSMRNISLHKLASFQQLYSFCLINTGAYDLQLTVNLRWGMELMDLQVLASENDQQQILDEARWIQKQTDKIHEIITSSMVLRGNREELNNVMGVKMVISAGIGLFVLVLISLYFYFWVRKSFHERKLI